MDDLIDSQTRARLGVSTWSLHRALGVSFPDGPGRPNEGRREETWGSGELDLLEVPARAAAMGLGNLEICHFQFPSREPAYLQDLSDAAREAGVCIWSLLVDDGDLTHPEHGRRDRDWVAGWLDTAGELGAKTARVIAGKTAGEGAIGRSIESMNALADHAKSVGVKLTTENWFPVLEKPADVHALLDASGGRIGLKADFGNWGGPTKYADLASILPRAESCHTKCHFPAAGVMDRTDFRRCLDLSRTAGFAGPHILIYDGPGDNEWDALLMERDVVVPYIAH